MRKLIITLLNGAGEMFIIVITGAVTLLFCFALMAFAGWVVSWFF